jgi:outer membrane protein assembly factor BamB
MAHCLDLKTGAVIWAVDTAARFDTEPGFFGRLSSPLIHGELLLLNVGGKNNAGIVALKLEDGATAWGATDHEASYSSPTLFEHGGKTRAVFFTRNGLTVLDPDTGAVLADRYFRSAQHASVNAATPLVHNGRIFATTSYDVGAGFFAFTGDELKTIWANDQTLSSQYATPLLHEGYLYGFHGRVDFASDQLRCVELATGKGAWGDNDTRNGSVLLAGDKLLILEDTGRLTIAEPSAENFKPLARATVLGRDGRAAPALSNGFLYARDQEKLICLDLR